MTTVLVPLDGTSLAERALRHASRIAEATGADILLTTGEEGRPPPALEAYLDRQARDLRPAAGTIVRTTAEGVVAAAAATAEPIIVMSSQDHAGLGDALSPTMDEGVVRHAGCPIILIGPRCPSPDVLAQRTRLLVCTDGSTHSEAVVPAATALAGALGLRPTVFQVSPSGILVARVGRPRDVASAERVAGRMREADLETDFETIRDPDPAAAIIEFATEQAAGVIAIATHGRTGLSRVVLGSVAADVVRHARCPVLTVRPHLG